MIKSKIISGSTIDVFGTIINALTSFVFLRLYFTIITKEEYGIWLAVFGVASLIGIVNIGIDQYFLTIIPNNSKFFHPEFKVDLSNFILIKILIVLIFFVFGLILYFFLNKILIIPQNYLQAANNVFLLSVLVLLFNIISSTASTILIGRGHFSLNNIIVNVGIFISNGLTLLLLHFKLGILSFPAALLSVSVSQFIVLYLVIKKKYQHLSLGIPNFYGKKEMLNYSFSFQILNWAYLIRSQILFILLNNIVGPTSVTIYNITNRIPQMIPVYMNKIIAPLFPTYATLVFNNEKEKVKEILLKVIKFLFRFSLFFGIGIILFNRIFIQLWVGIDKYGGSTINILLTLYTILISSFCGFGMIVYATKKFEKWPIISILEILSTFVTCYFLGKRYGFIGIFSGFLITTFISQLYLATISLKQASINLNELVKKSFTFVILPNIISMLIGVFYVLLSKHPTWLNLIFGILVYSISHFSIRELPILLFNKGKSFKERLNEIISI
jgi:O-antigen/teichoic acid export membrane protein